MGKICEANKGQHYDTGDTNYYDTGDTKGQKSAKTLRGDISLETSLYLNGKAGVTMQKDWQGPDSPISTDDSKSIPVKIVETAKPEKHRF
jgi:hypothetical protein